MQRTTQEAVPGLAEFALSFATDQNKQEDFKVVLEEIKNVRDWKRSRKRPTKIDEQKQEGGE